MNDEGTFFGSNRDPGPYNEGVPVFRVEERPSFSSVLDVLEVDSGVDAGEEGEGEEVPSPSSNKSSSLFCERVGAGDASIVVGVTVVSSPSPLFFDTLITFAAEVNAATAFGSGIHADGTQTRMRYLHMLGSSTSSKEGTAM